MTVTLHTEPFRHYKIVNPETGKVTWNGANKQRVQSVTDILDPDQGALLRWAVERAVVAAEAAVLTYLPETAPVLARSVLDFPALMAITGQMPDAVRDAKADLGTEAHEYLAGRLLRRDVSGLPVEYGYQLAIDEFVAACTPVPMVDAAGPRVERAVGSFDRAIAGTYDAQVRMAAADTPGVAVHRIDLKSSNSIRAKALAQLAAYERLAVTEHGEEPSDYLTVVHIDPMGNHKTHSVAIRSEAHLAALELFEAHVTLRRAGALLDKVLR